MAPGVARALQAAGHEHELPAGAVGRVPYVLQRVAVVREVRHDLLALAEPQGRFRGEHLPVRREHVRRAERDQRAFHRGHFVPALYRADAGHLGADVRALTGPGLPGAAGRVTRLEDQAAAGAQGRVGAAQGGAPGAGVRDRLGDVRGHGGQVGRERRQVRRVALDPADAPGARLGAGHVEGGSGRVDAHDIDPRVREHQCEDARAAADVQHPAGAELPRHAQIGVEVAPVGVERVVEGGEAGVCEGGVSHGRRPPSARRTPCAAPPP